MNAIVHQKEPFFMIKFQRFRDRCRCINQQMQYITQLDSRRNHIINSMKKEKAFKISIKVTAKLGKDGVLFKIIKAINAMPLANTILSGENTLR